MKKILRISALAAALMFALCVFAAAFVEKPAEGTYYADYARVLSESTESYIQKSNKKLNSSIGAEIMVVTVDYLDGYYADEYATLLLNRWDIGGEDENSMLLLIAAEQSSAFLAVGDGIYKNFGQLKAEEYMTKYFNSSFRKGDYDKAVENLLEKLFDWYDDQYEYISASQAQESSIYDYGDDSEYYEESSPFLGFSFSLRKLVFVAIAIVLVVAAFSSKVDKTRYKTFNRSSGSASTPYKLSYFFRSMSNSPWRSSQYNHPYGPYSHSSSASRGPAQSRTSSGFRGQQSSGGAKTPPGFKPGSASRSSSSTRGPKDQHR